MKLANRLIWILLGNFFGRVCLAVTVYFPPQTCLPITEVEGDLRSRVPWTVGIYYKPSRNSTLRFLITGTVVGPSTVLTLFASGASAPATEPSNNKNYKIFPPELILVGAGIRSTNLKEIDEFAQLREVRYVVPYGPGSRTSVFQYFLVHLKTPLSFTTPYVRPICFGSTNSSKGINSFGWNLILAGFSTPRGQDGGLQLRTQLLYPGTRAECEQAYQFYYQTTSSSGLICGRIYTDEAETEAHCLLHGSPGFIYVENVALLGGITAVIPSMKRKSGTCEDGTVYFLANISPALDWIRRNVICSENNEFACSDGQCTKAAGSCRTNAENSVSKVVLRTSKNSDTRLAKRRNSKQSSPVQCLPLPPVEGISAICTDESGDQVDCESAGPGANVELRCAKFYISNLRQSFVRMTCGEDGKWTPYRPLACKPGN